MSQGYSCPMERLGESAPLKSGDPFLLSDARDLSHAAPWGKLIPGPWNAARRGLEG